MPAPETPARFLVTGLPRVGTNLILHSLAAHPRILAYNELFNTHRILWGSSAMDEEADPAYLALRAAHPLVFIEHVLSPGPPECKAVGFKLFYMQASEVESENYRLVWPHLQRMEGLKVVDVARDNRLNQAFSWIKARRTRVWVEKGRDVPDPQEPIAIGFEELHGYFQWFESMQELRAQRLCGMDVLEVRYEQMAEDFPSHIRRIQEHLGVPPLPLPTATRKQRIRPVTVSIANYRELRERFVQTPFLTYFEMAEEAARCRQAAA